MEPDLWCILKIKSIKSTKDAKSNISINPHYRVFGSWSGDFLKGDSWKMNSGIIKIEEDDMFYYFYGESGSCYKCYKSAYGVTTYGYSIIKGWLDASDGFLELLKDEFNWMEIKYDEMF